MITFDLINQTKIKVNAKLIKKIIEDFSVQAKIKQPVYLSLVLVDKKVIRKWNLIYRGKDKPTDVLSFAQRDCAEIPGEEKELGEILICLTVAREQAKKYGWSLDYELARLLIHGLAHLAGYEHEEVSEKEAKRMTNFESSVMSMNHLK
jgi:probable rRNA maturation factor